MPISPPFSPPGAWEMVLVSAAGALGAGALAFLNNGSLSLVALCALGGLTGRLVRALGSFGGLDLITATLIGVVCSTLLVIFIDAPERRQAQERTQQASLKRAGVTLTRSRSKCATGTATGAWVARVLAADGL